jgi:hypothetical protein
MGTNHRYAGVAVALAAILLAGGCHRMGPPEGDDDWDDDADDDGGFGWPGTDSDGDADSDSDGDTGEDPDTGPPTCPANSGWPCVCDLEFGDTCDDGSLCGQIAGLQNSDLGICSLGCDVPDTPCQDTYWDAESMCLLMNTMDYGYQCGLVCDSDVECPPQQTCQFVEPEYYFCHP